MIIKVGERIKNNLTGKVYELKMIKNEWVLLEEENGLSQVLTETKNIESLYERANESLIKNQ